MYDKNRDVQLKTPQQWRIRMPQVSFVVLDIQYLLKYYCNNSKVINSRNQTTKHMLYIDSSCYINQRHMSNLFSGLN